MRNTHKAPVYWDPEARVPPTQAEFDAAFIRLQERYDRLSFDVYHELTCEEREALTLLEDDSDELLRHDQDILRDHALSRGIDLGTDAYKKRAPVVYMTQLLLKLGYGSLEDVYREYPQLKNGAIACR